MSDLVPEWARALLFVVSGTDKSGYYVKLGFATAADTASAHNWLARWPSPKAEGLDTPSFGERTRDALAPFANAIKLGGYDDQVIVELPGGPLTRGDFRKLTALYQEVLK